MAVLFDHPVMLFHVWVLLWSPNKRLSINKRVYTATCRHLFSSLFLYLSCNVSYFLLIFSSTQATHSTFYSGNGIKRVKGNGNKMRRLRHAQRVPTQTKRMQKNGASYIKIIYLSTVDGCSIMPKP